MWYDIAFWSGIAAIVTALVAALPGFGDYFTVARNTDARNIATFHMLLNLSIVGLYFVGMLLMLDNGALNGGDLTLVVALHALGTGLLLLSGWLGGELVYRHHLAMIPDDSELEAAEDSIHHRAPGFRGGAQPAKLALTDSIARLGCPLWRSAWQLRLESSPKSSGSAYSHHSGSPCAGSLKSNFFSAATRRPGVRRLLRGNVRLRVKISPACERPSRIASRASRR